MNILFIENAGHKSAGAFISLVTLVCELRKYGVDSYLLIPDRADGTELLDKNDIVYLKLRECSYSQMLSKKATFFEKCKMPFKDIKIKSAAKKVMKFVYEHNIEIVHENTSASYLGYYISKMCNIKHVWHIREFMEEDFGCTLWKRERALRRFNEADAVIAISQSIYEKYKNDVGSNMSIIYNGIDIKRFLNDRVEIFNNEVVNILSVGRVTEGKGQLILLEAITKLRTLYTNFHVTFIGNQSDIGYMKVLKDYIAINSIREYVTFIEQVDDIQSMYSTSDIFCMTSKCEAFGKVTIEAMVSGCLVVGSNSGGTKEIISDDINGVLFESMNSDNLADKLIEIWGEKEKYKQVAINGKKEACDKYSAERNAKEIESIYRKIVDIN